MSYRCDKVKFRLTLAVEFAGQHETSEYEYVPVADDPIVPLLVAKIDELNLAAIRAEAAAGNPPNPGFA